MQESVKLIENAIVFTNDEKHRSGMLPLLIRGERIAEIGGRAEALSTQFPNLERINAAGKVALPGFIDAFHRSESVLLRFLSPSVMPHGKNVKEALQKAYLYLTSQASEEELVTLYRLAYFSALKAGVTTLTEYGMDYFDTSFHAALEAMEQSEVRGYLVLRNGDQYEAAAKQKRKGIHYAVALPQENELTLYNLQTTLRYAHQRQLPIVIVDNRHAYEVLKKKFGKSLLQLCKEYRIFENVAFIVNPICSEKEDAEILKNKKQCIIVTPHQWNEELSFSERYCESLPLALGSGWGVANPFAVMRDLMKWYAQRGLNHIHPHNILATHTLTAAQALLLGNETGSIEVGKKADIIFLDGSGIARQPFLHSVDPDLVLQFILSEMTSRDVTDVMIGGEFYIRERTILIYSEEELVRQASDLLAKVLEQSGLKSVEVQPKGEILPFAPSQESESNDIPFEEGFRIVRRQEEGKQTNTSSPLSSEQKQSSTVRRVFGEDDIE